MLPFVIKSQWRYKSNRYMMYHGTQVVWSLVVEYLPSISKSLSMSRKKDPTVLIRVFPYFWIFYFRSLKCRGFVVLFVYLLL